MQLRAPAPQLAELHGRLLESAPAEAAAFMAVERSGSGLVLHSSRVFDRSELEGDGHGELVLGEHAQAEGLAELKRNGHGLVEVHTHPGSYRHIQFSSYDDEQLPRFARYVMLKLSGRPFGALVLGPGGYAGRAWRKDTVEPLELRAVGEAAAVPSWLAPTSESDEWSAPNRFDRQVRSLGPEGQRRIAALRVGIVGLGGTGSQVVQQLAHLGARNFTLVEDDRVEVTNLPRLAGAGMMDALLRRRKTAVAKRVIRRLSRRVGVSCTGPLRSKRSLEALTEVDLIVGCVDNDGARLVLTELAAAHLVPYLDLGVGIESSPGEPGAVGGGRVAFYLPGRPCLACADDLDFAEAAEDLESEELRRVRIARGYAADRRVEAALMPLNTAVVGLGMMELLAFATGVRPVRPFFRYDAVEQRLIAQRVSLDSNCPVCGPAAGMGDRQAVSRYALD